MAVTALQQQRKTARQMTRKRRKEGGFPHFCRRRRLRIAATADRRIPSDFPQRGFFAAFRPPEIPSAGRLDSLLAEPGISIANH